MAIANVNQITSMLRMMDDRPQNPELQRYAQLHKNDPFLFPLIVAEDTARKAMRAAAQARAMGGEPPKVNDQAVASIGQQPMPPQGAGPAPGGPGGIAALQAPNMQRMADGGIAGYPDDEEVGMAEGGVARYNGQTESRVQQDVQFARDQEAFGILLSELQKAQAQAAQGDQRAQGDVAAIQGELRRHIKRNPSFAQMLTGALPMGTAQAAPVQAAPQAAMPAPAGQIPTATPGTQAPPAAEEGFFSRLGSQMGLSEEAKRNIGNILMAPTPMGVVTAPAKVPGEATGLAKVYEGVQRFFAPPSTARKFTPAEIKSIQATKSAERTAKEAEEAAEAARMAGALPGEAQTAAVGVQAAQAAKQVAYAPSAAERVQLLNQAQRAREAARVVQPVSPGVAAAQVGKQMAAAGAATMPSPVAPEAAPAVDDTYRQEGLNYPRKEDLSKDQKKDIVDAAKAVTPKANSEGWTNEDWLIAGLAALANPSRLPGFSGLLATIGGAGLAAAENKKARRKATLEEAKEASEAKYREALGEQARRGPSEIALIERVAKENNIPFTQAMEMIYSSKREPQTEEALMKAWSSSAFLQMKYPDPQQYIKLMRASTGGASQTSAADQALVSKYLNPR